MAHKWETVNQGPQGLMNYGKRKCALCGAEQTNHGGESLDTSGGRLPVDVQEK